MNYLIISLQFQIKLGIEANPTFNRFDSHSSVNQSQFNNGYRYVINLMFNIVIRDSSFTPFPHQKLFRVKLK